MLMCSTADFSAHEVWAEPTKDTFKFFFQVFHFHICITCGLYITSSFPLYDVVDRFYEAKAESKSERRQNAYMYTNVHAK
jgi:hypothetical protein